MNYKKFKNSVHPTKDQMSGFLEGKDDKPISMINLLKYKEKAEYEDRSSVIGVWSLVFSDYPRSSVFIVSVGRVFSDVYRGPRGCLW